MNDADTETDQILGPTSDAAARGPRPTQMEVFMNSRYLTNAALALDRWVHGRRIAGVAPGDLHVADVLGRHPRGAAELGHRPRGRGNVQRGIDGLIGGLGAWTIVASLVFSGTVVTWLGFASGAAFVGLAFVGLTLHELYTERVVHSIEVRATDADRELSGITA